MTEESSPEPRAPRSDLCYNRRAMKAWIAIVAVVAASLAGAAPPLVAVDLGCVETGGADCCALECGHCPCCVQAPPPHLSGPAPVAGERAVARLPADGPPTPPAPLARDVLHVPKARPNA